MAAPGGLNNTPTHTSPADTRKDYERPIEGESTKAYAAFVRYRDLGPRRSIDAAVALAGKGKRSTCWERWAAKFHWVDRATAFDAFVADRNLQATLEEFRQLHDRRMKYQLVNQDRLEAQVAKMEAALAKIELSPGTDIIQVKADGSRTKVKGLDAGGYARLVKETNATAREVILGPRLGLDLKALDADSGGIPEPQDVTWVKRSG